MLANLTAPIGAPALAFTQIKVRGRARH